MVHQDSGKQFKSISLMAALELTGVALAASLLVPVPVPVPVHAEARTAVAIECPRTIVSPEAQKKMDAGQKPEIVKSRYRPGLVNPQGFVPLRSPQMVRGCFKSTTKPMSVGKIPVRFEYNTIGLFGYAGEKGMPLGRGPADMFCLAPDRGESVVDCTISLTADGAMSFRRKEGRGTPDESEVAIDAKQIFGIDVRPIETHVHYDMASNGKIEEGTFRQFWEMRRVDCTKPYWKNKATEIWLATGRRNGAALALSDRYEMESVNEMLSTNTLDESQMFPRFYVKDALASKVINSVFNNVVVQVDVKTACEGNLSKAYLTELPRVMSHVYESLKLRMLTQRE